MASDFGSKLTRVGLIVLACGILAGGVWLQNRHFANRLEGRSDQLQAQARQDLIRRLADQPLFVATATGYQRRKADRLDDLLEAIDQAEVDLLACYQSPQADAAKPSLAYLMLLDDDPRYIEHLAQSPAEAHSAEPVLWVSLLQDRALPPATADRLDKVLLRSPSPAGRWYAAGQADDPNVRRELLLGLLDESSYFGIQAARKLADRPATRPPAVAYLWQQIQAGQDELANEALHTLVRTAGGQGWPEYLAYLQAQRQATREGLVQRLRAELPPPDESARR